MQKHNFATSTRLNGWTNENGDLEDAKQMPEAEHGKDAESGLFHIKPIHCPARHHTEQLRTAWEDSNLRPSERIQNDRLAQAETKACSSHAYGLERHVTEESSQADSCPLDTDSTDELRVADDSPRQSQEGSSVEQSVI